MSRLPQQWKRNNQGASLVSALVIVSMIVILIAVVLSATLLNYYMKYQNEQSQGNFYDAESAMEEIRMGLIAEMSDVTAASYAQILSQYSEMADEVKEEEFRKAFTAGMKQRLVGENGPASQLYSIALLESYLRETRWVEERRAGARVVTRTGDNYLNQTPEGVVLKNVTVSYLDEKDNLTEIAADIVLNFPPISFVSTSSIDNILCYALIADEQYRQTGSAAILGNAYLGRGKTAGGRTYAAQINGGTLNLEGIEGTIGYAINGADTVVTGNGAIESNGVEWWTKSLLLESSSDFIMNDGTLYLQNDMVLGENAKASLDGQLYAFGNPETAKRSAAITAEDVEREPADYSSSLIVHGPDAGLDLSGLNALLIAGASYVQNVTTGQSITAKGDQRAYLVPAELIGVGYDNGGANPMTAKQWEGLRNEICEANGYASWSDIRHPEDVAALDRDVPELGASLRALGVKDYSICVYPNGATGGLYYFFMEFNSQEEANSFFRTYSRAAVNYSQLQSSIDYYAGKNILLPPNTNDISRFYFQGNVVASRQADLVIPDKLTSADNTEELQQEIADMQVAYQDAFAALNTCLTMEYEGLGNRQGHTVYENIVKSITGGTKKFVSTEGVGAVVTPAPSYTVNHADVKNVKDVEGNTHADAEVNLVICPGDVTVGVDFTGLIIAGGTITVEHGATLHADPTATAIALKSMNPAQDDCAANYIKNVNVYLVGGIGSSADDDAAVSFAQLITYDNWKKR